MKLILSLGGVVLAMCAAEADIDRREGFALVETGSGTTTISGDFSVVDYAGEDAVPGARYHGGKLVVDEAAPAALTDENREAKRQAVREKRRQIEAAGTSLEGVPLSTSDSSLLKSNGAVSLFREDPSLKAVDFEAQPGHWVSLDADRMRAVAVKIGRHIQAAYSNARALDELIVEAKTRADLDAIDIDTGWPA